MNFTEWLDDILSKELSPDITAINFNLYEDTDNQWSIEFVGAGSFDADNSDWACDEIFVTRDNPFTWTEETAWETILSKSVNEIQTYLETGDYAGKLKAYKGIGAGFVDGDITIIYQKN